MNRFLSVLFAGLFALTTASSCKKCVTCTVYDKRGEVFSALNNIETCGSKDDVRDAENEANELAAAIDGSANCTTP